MLDNFIFENHLGQRFIGLSNGVYANSNELRNYSWDYETINNRISRFYHKITKRKIPLVVHCKTEDEAMRVRNKLMELAETDIDATIPGKVFVGDYYTIGYIAVSKKKNYLVTERYCILELTLLSDDPAWYREQTYSFPVGGVDNRTDDDTEDDSDTGGIKPEGTLNIVANGTYDVVKYATVSVNIAESTTNITATHDGQGNVYLGGVFAASDESGNVTLA